MANLGRTISNINTLSSFTAKVVYAASDRYGQAQANVTFQSGYEYQGANFFKGLNRPPKLRILLIFQPLVSGSPNTSNDTYVAFQVYDYTLNVWRGPWCKRKTVNDALTYVDYFITTIDSFGRKYGNNYTGTGSSSSTGGFTVPTPTYSTSGQLPLSTLSGRSATVIAGHNPNIFTLAGNTNKMYHFHGFLTLSGLTGTWCFYSISANGSGIGFNHLLDQAPYNTGTYPNVLPYTNKLTSEWRYATFCNIDSLGYSPRVKVTSTGPIKYYAGASPAEAFPLGVDGINLVQTEVWCTYDPQSASNFFLTPLWRPGSTEDESALGVEGTQAASYAPAGWYGTTAENSYAYWDGLGSWTPNTYATYSTGPTLTSFDYGNGYPQQNMACAFGPTDRPIATAWTLAFSIGSKLYNDSAGLDPLLLGPMYYYNYGTNQVFTVDPMTGQISDIITC